MTEYAMKDIVEKVLSEDTNSYKVFLNTLDGCETLYHKYYITNNGDIFGPKGLMKVHKNGWIGLWTTENKQKSYKAIELFNKAFGKMKTHIDSRIVTHIDSRIRIEDIDIILRLNEQVLSIEEIYNFIRIKDML